MFAIIIVAIGIIITAYLWPTTKLQTPVVFERTIIKNVNIVDVVTGEVIADQFVLIEQSRITKIDTTHITASDDVLLIDGTGYIIRFTLQMVLLV